MPVDKPKAGETQEEYLAYCIPAEINAGYEQEQASAICYETYRKETGMSGVNLIASKLREIQYKGIKLAEGDGLEDSCWDGYEAIGTKILDGRSVPNCVPIKD
jgi:hypothetical protein